MDHKVTQIMEKYGCDAETATRYLELKAEGYTPYQASIMSGLRDPDEAYE